MQRKLRLEFPGAMSHACPAVAFSCSPAKADLSRRSLFFFSSEGWIMSRGDQREDLFLCGVDRYDFLKTQGAP
jgi:hypothetical protein